MTFSYVVQTRLQLSSGIQHATPSISHFRCYDELKYQSNTPHPRPYRTSLNMIGLNLTCEELNKYNIPFHHKTFQAMSFLTSLCWHNNKCPCLLYIKIDCSTSGNFRHAGCKKYRQSDCSANIGRALPLINKNMTQD